MNFTTKDTNQLKSSYLAFLKKLKEFIYIHNFDNIEKVNTTLSYMLKNGYFTIETKMLLTDKYNYLELPPELEDGIQVMTGICCCRHANDISFNILRKLGYDCKKAFFYVNNETGTWYEKPDVWGNNHIALSIKQTETRIIVDTYNDITFSIDNGKIKSLRQELTLEEMAVRGKYNDKENIEPIAKTLSKYYQLRKLGITHVYDDEEYGEY